MRRLLLAVLCAAAVGAGAASSSGAERSWVIQGDTVIGGFLVQKDGTLYGAIRQFGPPTSKRRDLASGWNGCLVIWKNLGLRIFFYNLGGHDSCQPQYGYFRDALITGKKWRTASGLRIGDPMRWIFRYHANPKRIGTGAWWSLLQRVPPYGDGTGYTALGAKINRGSVSAFSVWYQAGGE